MDSMSSETILNFLRMQVTEAEKFTEEVLSEARKINSRINALRKRISTQIQTPRNMRGLLGGWTDDYLPSFEPTMIQLETKLRQNTEDLRKKAQSHDKSLQHQIEKFRGYCSGIQNVIHDVVYKR